MSKTELTAQVRLPYRAEDLCRMVGDVKLYPRFIPWIRSLRVLRETPLASGVGGWEGVAEAVVGWKAVVERFATRVRSEPAKGEVDVELVSGPFRSLVNRWRFTDRPDGGAEVRFLIVYEFRNPLLNALVRANRDRAAGKIMEAFEAEAHRRFGASAGVCG